MAALSFFIVVISISFRSITAYGTCDDVFHIEKYTVATSDAYRDTYYVYNIFPYLDEQDTEHFISGMCANGMKVQLPDSCFKIHAPQTWEHDEGLLKVETLEKKFTLKWKYVMSTKSSTYNYDSFLDFNIAFWVESLDPYIEKWLQFNEEFEYIGIEWKYTLSDIDLQIHSNHYKNNKFYSILIHSPQSAMNYEFISYTKPSLQIKWIYSSIERATFKGHNDPYPWNRDDETPIVPVRISRATTDIEAMIDFYTDVMEAQILYDSNGIIIDDLGGDNVETKTVFLLAGDTKIELQFYERPEYYTAGEFTLKQYEQLLIETHDEVITTPFCGIDRWFDNHYGFSTWSNYGYMDRIIDKLNVRNQEKYRVYQTPYEHSSPFGKMNLDKYGASTTYIFFIFEPSGQCIQMMGDFADTHFGVNVPNWNTQWCYTRCPYNMKDGVVDHNHIYVDVEKYDDLDDGDERLLSLLGNQTIKSQRHQHMLEALILLMICSVIISALYYLYRKQKKRLFNDNEYEQTPLIRNIVN